MFWKKPASQLPTAPRTPSSETTPVSLLSNVMFWKKKDPVGKPSPSLSPSPSPLHEPQDIDEFVENDYIDDEYIEDEFVEDEFVEVVADPTIVRTDDGLYVYEDIDWDRDYCSLLAIKLVTLITLAIGAFVYYQSIVASGSFDDSTTGLPIVLNEIYFITLWDYRYTWNWGNPNTHIGSIGTAITLVRVSIIIAFTFSVLSPAATILASKSSIWHWLALFFDLLVCAFASVAFGVFATVFGPNEIDIPLNDPDGDVIVLTVGFGLGWGFTIAGFALSFITLSAEIYRAFFFKASTLNPDEPRPLPHQRDYVLSDDVYANPRLSDTLEIPTRSSAVDGAAGSEADVKANLNV